MKAKRIFTISLGIMLAVAAIILAASCSHNPAVFVLGEQTRLGFGDYGAYSSSQGIVITDIPRENSSWELEIDSSTGINYDPKTGTVRGIKRIRRTVGLQITGYLVDLAKRNPDLARKYIENNTLRKEKESNVTE